MFIASQVAALDTTTVGHLWIVSTMLGTAYGSLFNVLPMLVLEWFGMSGWSLDWFLESFTNDSCRPFQSGKLLDRRRYGK